MKRKVLLLQNSAKALVAAKQEDADRIVSVKLEQTAELAKEVEAKSNEVEAKSRELEAKSEEYDKLKDQRMCAVCWEDEASHALEPCMHLCVCEECLGRLPGDPPPCPMCRAATTGSRKVFYG